MERDEAPPPAATAKSPRGFAGFGLQGFAGFALATAVMALGVWVLFDFLPAFAWAGVLAIALWPLYQRLLWLLPERSERVLGPLLSTIGVAIVVIAPLVLLGLAVAREIPLVIKFTAEARRHGIPPPAWISEFPLAGPTAAEWWRTHIGDPAMADEMFGRIDLPTLTASARQYGGEVLHRLAILLFTLLTLFFVFRDGRRLVDELRALSDRLIGLRGERIARQMIAAVHGTVTGLVLVGLAEGILLGVVYFIVGLPYPASVGAVTGVAAVIPFAAPVVYVLAGLYLFSAGNTLGGIVIIVFGSVLLFVADHFVRPVLIGGAARLPFLLVLLGILGGLDTMGFLGLFLGPAVMAALVALWREWTDPSSAPQVARRASSRPPPRPPAGRVGKA